MVDWRQIWPTYSLEILVTLAVVVGLVVGKTVVEPLRTQTTLPKNPKGPMETMRLGGAELEVEVRDDEAGRGLGYSGRESIGADEGMLFVFGEPVQPVFWMKDMLFDLDVVWILGGKVIQIHEKMPAPTKDDPVAKTMTPSEPIDAVLEVAAGYVSERGIKVGDAAELVK